MYVSERCGRNEVLNDATAIFVVLIAVDVDVDNELIAEELVLIPLEVEVDNDNSARLFFGSRLGM